MTTEERASYIVRKLGRVQERVGGDIYTVRWPKTASRALFSDTVEGLLRKLEKALRKEQNK